MFVRSMADDVKPFVLDEEFTHYAAVEYSPKWTDDQETKTVEPSSAFDA